MAKADETTGNPTPARGGGALLRSWRFIAVLIVLVVMIPGGGGYWFLILRHPSEAAAEQAPAEPQVQLPFYLEVKPFVVSIANSSGIPHFVQIGLNLALSGSDAGNAVTAILPEVQDAMRQTAVGFKVDDIVTPAGIDKLREAMIANANRVLLQRLGPDRAKKLSGGEPNSGVVQNVYFTTLIVE